MASKKTAAKLLFAMLMITALLGCSRPLLNESVIVYPQPPEEPRIVYLRSHYGQVDFRSVNFLDYIFGVDARTDVQKPYGVTAQGDKVYISLTGSGSILVIDNKERSTRYIGDGSSGKLELPIGVAVSKDGNVYVADAKIKRVFGYDAKGKLTFAIGGPETFTNPAGIALSDALGRIYVVDSYAHTVRVFSMKGEPLFSFGKGGSADGDFNYPSNIAIDRRNGNLYIVDTQNFRVQVFDKDGKFLRKFGKLGDQAGDFSRPKGIGVDSEGHVYVSDAAFDNLQVFDENGLLLLFIGGAGMGPGYFQVPAGLFVDENDRIYVSDSLNNRVQVFQYLSEKWKRANPGEYEKYRFKQGS